MEKKTASAIMLTLLLTSMLTLAFNIQPVKASETIYIRADGSVDPPTAPITTVDNVTYVLTDNIYDSVVVERDSIVVDGAGYLLQGSGTGVDLSNENNVTIRNMRIDKFEQGIVLSSSNYNAIHCNNITAFFDGIVLVNNSNNNTLTGNNIARSAYGVWLEASSNNTIAENSITINTNGLYIKSSTNNIAMQNKLVNNAYGIFLILSSDNIVSKNSISGSVASINLYWSSNNNITQNMITTTEYRGIDLRDSLYNNIIENNLADNGYGISLLSSSNNYIYHNNLIHNSIQASIESSTSYWDNGYPSGGNYWSDYSERYPNASEIDDSGLWDTAYVIEGINQDSYPLMEHWSAPWMDWNHYHNYTEIINTLFYLNNTYSGLVDLFSIGKSWQNRDIYCIRLTNETNTHPKPKVFFVGYHHARELISTELLLYFAVEAATNFGTNETISHMLNYSEIYIVPALNVDGSNTVKQNEWQRKNAHPFDEDNDTLLDEDPPEDIDGDGYIEDLIRWDGYQWVFVRWEGIDNDGDGLLNEDWVGGVDLNRNYGYQWNASCYSGSPYAWAEDYRGPAPFSEPETQAIRDLALSNDFRYAISVHSGSESIGYPWGYTTDPPHDEAIFNEIAANLSALTGAQYGQNSYMYTMSGSWDDWMYANRSTFALTCEIYTNNSAWQYEPGPEPDTLWEKGVFQFFNPDPANIETVVQRWLPAFTYVTNRAITEAYDITTTNVTPLKTIVGQGYSTQIDVNVTNKGDFTETFNVTVYANTTIIGSENVTLPAGNSTTMAFTWNTAGFAYGNYTVSAYAWPVPGETSTSDNTFSDGTVIISHVGDITGDGKCDIQDLARVSAAFGSLRINDPDDPRYGQYWHPVTCPTCPHTPNADITNDAKIDIQDLARTSANFGWHQ